MPIMLLKASPSRALNRTRTTHTTHWKKRRLMGALNSKLLRAALFSSTIPADAAQRIFSFIAIVNLSKSFYSFRADVKVWALMITPLWGIMFDLQLVLETSINNVYKACFASILKLHALMIFFNFSSEALSTAEILESFKLRSTVASFDSRGTEVYHSNSRCQQRAG